MTRTIDSRQRILTAASRLFVENGLQSSMAAIASNANVATGSLYNYFPSKEGLILEVCRQLAASMQRDLVEPIDKTLPFQQRVEAYTSAYIDFIWADADRAILYDYVTNSPAIEHEELARIFDIITSHSIAVFSETRERDLDRGLSAKLTGSFVRGAIRNTLKRHRATGEPFSEEQKARIIRMCWNALAL